MKSAAKRFQFIPQHFLVEGSWFSCTQIHAKMCWPWQYVLCEPALALCSICSNGNSGEVCYASKWFGNRHWVPLGFPLTDGCSQLSFRRTCMAIAAYWVLNVACCPTQHVGWNAEHVALPRAPSYFTISNNTKTARPACHNWLMEGNTRNPNAQLWITIFFKKAISLLSVVLKQVKRQHVIAVFWSRAIMLSKMTTFKSCRALYAEIARRTREWEEAGWGKNRAIRGEDVVFLGSHQPALNKFLLI